MKVVVLALMIFFLPLPAQAYVGPGSGLGAILLAIAILLGLLLLVWGYVWYPLKRLLRGKNAETGQDMAKADDYSTVPRED